METVKRANNLTMLLVPLMHVIFALNCIVGYGDYSSSLVHLFVTVVIGSINCSALYLIYKNDKASIFIKYISLSGLYINYAYLFFATELSASNIIATFVLLLLSLMYLDLILIKSFAAILAFTYLIHSIARISDITVFKVILLLAIYAGLGFIGYKSLYFFDNIVKLFKNYVETSTNDNNSIRNMANFIYEEATQLGDDTKLLKRDSNDFQKSLLEVTQSIENIASGFSSVVYDTEKISIHLTEMEKNMSENQEYLKIVTDNIKQIIENKNLGLKLMSELKKLTETTSEAIAEIDKMVKETSSNTDKIVQAGQTIKQISTQTNLLALNASIVATTAGKNSKGFMVISNEIRKLSDETNKYVKIIQDYTSELSDSVVNAVKALGKVNLAIENQLKGVKDMDNILEKINSSTSSTQKYISSLNESAKSIFKQTMEINESVTNLYAINEECSAFTRQSYGNMQRQNPYVESVVRLINNLYDMTNNLREKAMEIKLLIDIGIMIDYLDKNGVSNDNLRKICSKLGINTAYVADKTGKVNYSNEQICIGINLFEIDNTLTRLLDGATYIATPIKSRVEDGKTYKFLCVYRNDTIYELGIELTNTVEF